MSPVGRQGWLVRRTLRDERRLGVTPAPCEEEGRLCPLQLILQREMSGVSLLTRSWPQAWAFDASVP